MYTVTAFSLFAASIATASPRHEMRVERLAEKLSLSEDQEAAISEIFKNAADNCESIDSRKEHRACMKEQKESIQAKVRGQLSAEQASMFDTMRAERAERKSRGEGRGKKGGRRGQ